ncbi:hypothetical protein G6F37_004071 [Rhizopus arrhizus]|nr:hypothetical protein G6F38_004191 [Rhizopus arrhizus]KAG1160353.1 hypothetical protein G6F37_004071 [Rhizopus arrhizus]
MLSKVFTSRLLTNVARKVMIPKSLQWTVNTQRSVSTLSTSPNTHPVQLINYNIKETQSTATISEYVSRLRPFSAPPAPQPTTSPLTQVQEQFELTSVLRKRRLKMNKHKHKKLRKRTRALRKRLGK